MVMGVVNCDEFYPVTDGRACAAMSSVAAVALCMLWRCSCSTSSLRLLEAA